MKRLITLLLILFSVSAYSQNNITNTLGTGGVFTIKDISTNYLSLSQSTGQVNILKTLRLENTTNSTTGVIFKGTERFLHNHQANGTHGVNTFFGINAGNFTMSGTGIEASYNTGIGVNTLSSLTTGHSNLAMGVYTLYYNTSGTNNTGIGNSTLFNNSTGEFNTAIGSSSLFSNTTGKNNSAMGYQSLLSNTTGFSNTALGFRSLYSNVMGYMNTAVGDSALYSNNYGDQNTAIGNQSLRSNTEGIQNTAVGNGSLQNNTSGFFNTALGFESLYSCIIGAENTAIGYQTLRSTTTGNYNTTVGYYSLYNNTTGNRNTSLGSFNLSTNTTGTNNTAIGFDVQVPSGTSDNQVRIGNYSVTYAGVQVAWTITSDKRWKSDIQSSNLGLGFISKLNPVSYFRDNDESKRTEYGFIAQEIEEVLKESGTDNSGMLTITDEGMYELRYNDLLAPMVKAIQELKTEKDEEIAKLKLENDGLKKEVEILKTVNGRVAKLEQLVNELTEIKNATLTENK